MIIFRILQRRSRQVFLIPWRAAVAEPGSGGTAGGAGGRYRVQVGAFRNQVYANNLLRELQEQEYPARIEDSNGFYRVVVGSYPTLQEAAQMEQRLKWAGYPTIVIH